MPWDSTPRILPALMVTGWCAGFGGKAVAGQDQRHFVAGLEVLRAADDLPFAAAIVDAAKGEFVGVGMLVAREDLGDDDAVEFAAKLLHALDFQAEHGQALGQFLRRSSRNGRIAGAS